MLYNVIFILHIKLIKLPLQLRNLCFILWLIHDLMCGVIDHFKVKEITTIACPSLISQCFYSWGGATFATMTKSSRCHTLRMGLICKRKKKIPKTLGNQDVLHQNWTTPLIPNYNKLFIARIILCKTTSICNHL